jgi:hypothetical protein
MNNMQYNTDPTNDCPLIIVYIVTSNPTYGEKADQPIDLEAGTRDIAKGLPPILSSASVPTLSKIAQQSIL